MCFLCQNKLSNEHTPLPTDTSYQEQSVQVSRTWICSVRLRLPHPSVVSYQPVYLNPGVGFSSNTLLHLYSTGTTLKACWWESYENRTAWREGLQNGMHSAQTSPLISRHPRLQTNPSSRGQQLKWLHWWTLKFHRRLGASKQIISQKWSESDYKTFTSRLRRVK